MPCEIGGSRQVQALHGLLKERRSDIDIGRMRRRHRNAIAWTKAKRAFAGSASTAAPQSRPCLRSKPDPLNRGRPKRVGRPAEQISDPVARHRPARHRLVRGHEDTRPVPARLGPVAGPRCEDRTASGDICPVVCGEVLEIDVLGQLAASSEATTSRPEKLGWG